VVTHPPMLRGLRLLGPCAGLLALFSLLAPACKQSSNDRCEIDSDCASGLTCQTNSTTTTQHDGICGPGTATVPPPDAAVPDAPAADAPAADAPAAPDAVPSDIAPDTAAPDTTTSDSAPGDTAAAG
jgi:hypothetical protein